MYPHERSLVNRYKDQPFVIVGVNSDESLEQLQAVMKEEKLTWTSFFDGGGTGGPIATQWNVRGWPTVFILDKKGVIRAAGGRARAEMDKIVAELLSESDAG